MLRIGISNLQFPIFNQFSIYEFSIFGSAGLRKIGNWILEIDWKLQNGKLEISVRSTDGCPDFPLSGTAAASAAQPPKSDRLDCQWHYSTKYGKMQSARFRILTSIKEYNMRGLKPGTREGELAPDHPYAEPPENNHPSPGVQAIRRFFQLSPQKHLIKKPKTKIKGPSAQSEGH